VGHQQADRQQQPERQVELAGAQRQNPGDCSGYKRDDQDRGSGRHQPLRDQIQRAPLVFAQARDHA
jgi:hypothetical protein